MLPPGDECCPRRAADALRPLTPRRSPGIGEKSCVYGTSDKSTFSQPGTERGDEAPYWGDFNGLAALAAGGGWLDGAGCGESRNAAGARMAPRHRHRGGCAPPPAGARRGADSSPFVSRWEAFDRSPREGPRPRIRGQGRPTRPARLRAAARARVARGTRGSCRPPRSLRWQRVGASARHGGGSEAHLRPHSRLWAVHRRLMEN